jgi:hypothetical protein
MRAEEFAICDAVLTEACFHLPHQSQRRRLRVALDELNVHAVPASSGPEFWLQAFDWLDKYAEHESDWADACLAILSGHDPSLRIWTYDRECRTTWRRPNGSVIPLAVKATRGERS